MRFSFYNLLILAFFFSTLYSNTSILNTQDLIQDLINQSKDLKLADSQEWKNLLHINKYTSEITSPYFFLTQKQGKNLAQDELEATIKAFYQPISEVVIPQAIKRKRQRQIQEFEENKIKLPTRSIKPEDYHALCRFPARLAFLSKHLNFQNLPELECAEFKAMREYISPTKARIIFPSAHINSPASMFGHTFLLLDSQFNSRLLSFAINYQADANPHLENGFSFTFKGLFGLYTGSYSILPYYDKIKEYANTESRDIWEYELNLTPQEITQLYNHIWELSDSFSAYYFFHRNCSYNILWLLEVARPGLKLRQHFIYQVNPPETLFAMQKANLFTHSTYRPSKRSKLLAYEKVMSWSDTSKAKHLARNDLGKSNTIEQILSPQLTKTQQQYILESAIELSEYFFLKGKLSQQSYATIAHSLASKRSKLGQSTPPPLLAPSNPLEGNQSLRVTPLMLSNAQGYHPGLDFRITFHDITDNDKGYLKGAQIEFMRILGYYDTSTPNPLHAFKLYELNILSIASIAPLGKFFKPFSYRFETGLNRKFQNENLNYFLAFGGGAGVELTHFAYGFYLLEPTLYTDFHNANFMLSNVLGLVIQDHNRLKLTLEYKFKTYSLSSYAQSLNTTLSFNLIHNLGIFARGEFQSYPYTPDTLHATSMLGLRLYF